jgi:hypothetical protein
MATADNMGDFGEYGEFSDPALQEIIGFSPQVAVAYSILSLWPLLCSFLSGFSQLTPAFQGSLPFYTPFWRALVCGLIWDSFLENAWIFLVFFFVLEVSDDNHIPGLAPLF